MHSAVDTQLVLIQTQLSVTVVMAVAVLLGDTHRRLSVTLVAVSLGVAMCLCLLSYRISSGAGRGGDRGVRGCTKHVSFEPYEPDNDRTENKEGNKEAGEGDASVVFA